MIDYAMLSIISFFAAAIADDVAAAIIYAMALTPDAAMPLRNMLLPLH